MEGEKQQQQQQPESSTNTSNSENIGHFHAVDARQLLALFGNGENKFDLEDAEDSFDKFNAFIQYPTLVSRSPTASDYNAERAKVLRERNALIQRVGQLRASLVRANERETVPKEKVTRAESLLTAIDDSLVTLKKLIAELQ